MKQDPKAPQDSRSLQGESLRDAITELCDRKQVLFLATPYLTFESRFLEWAGADLRVRATMSRNVVRHAVDQQHLRLRFPWGLTLYGGPTKVLEYEDGEQAKCLRLALPPVLAPDDDRGGYRVDQVGRSTGALGSQDNRLMRITLENLAPGGLAVFCTEPLPPEGFQVGRSVNISLSLEAGPQLQAPGRVVHSNGQTLGLAFHPPLAGLALAGLKAWLEPRLAEAQRKWDDRATYRVLAERAAQPKAPPEGVLVVTGDPELRAAMGRALGDSHPLRAVAPALAPFREAMAHFPPYVLVLPATGRVEENRRLRTLLESVQLNCPVVVVGVGLDVDAGRAFAAEVKATLFLDRTTVNSAFFQRLILGLIRKHWMPLEGPGRT